jgi:hypothetical protein
MDEFRHRIPCNGRYQLFALTHRPQYAADAIFGYTVTTLAGDRLRDEPTLAMAMAWMDARIAQERPRQTIPAPTNIRRR